MLLIQMASAHADKPLVLGIIPYVSPDVLVQHQKSLKDHLERGLGKPISMVTAKNFKVFIQNAKAGVYDLVYAPPHLAYILEQDYAYQRVAMTTHKKRGLFIVKKTSPFKQLSDLRHTRIALVPALSLNSQMARKELRGVGLKANEDYTVIKVKNFSNALFSLVNDDSDAALSGVKPWKTFDKRYKGGLRVLAKTRIMQGFMIMAKPDLEQDTVQKLRQLSLSFSDTSAGKKYLFKGLKLIDDKSMQNLDEFTTILK
ncbi:MAG TPA: phosphate/phosphite/phosphonate ABC transporter substrate-binding protein [Gammaproteobacteria bacterium]|nr:phosphate/phosphite/phosphonate ABC transporter substrate-binding protein [Gammaproteobacteria bacterium]